VWRTAGLRVEPTPVLRTRPRLSAWLGLGAVTLAASLWGLGGWLALRLDRRIDGLDRSFELVDSDMAALDRRTGSAERRLSSVGERVRVLGHPLHASISWPISGPLLAGYGPRGSGWHSGVDVDAPEGAPVSAARTGNRCQHRLGGRLRQPGRRCARPWSRNDVRPSPRHHGGHRCLRVGIKHSRDRRLHRGVLRRPSPLRGADQRILERSPALAAGCLFR
jgi:hypothetical protein